MNIEKSIPTPNQHSQDQLHNFNYLIHANSNENYRALEHQIVAGSGVGDGAASGEGQVQPFDESSSGFTPPEQQIISRSDLSVQLRRQVDQVQSQDADGNKNLHVNTKKQSLTQLDFNFQNEISLPPVDRQGRMTPRRQQRLISKLNEIYEAQLKNDADMHERS